MVTTVPARLDIRSGCAVAEQVDHLADQDLEVHVRLVAEGRAHRHHPADVAVVVGAEHDEAPVEAAAALVEVVGEVTGEVGALPLDRMITRSLSSPNFSVRSQSAPSSLVGVAELGQPLDGLLHRAAVVQVVLVEVDVEVDPELVQALLDLGEHHLDALGPETSCASSSGRSRIPGCLAQHRLGDLVDVGAAVAVLGHRPALGAGQQRAREPVDLAAVVVEVVLPGDLGAGQREDAAEGVTHRRPARRRRCAADRSGWRRRTRG